MNCSADARPGGNVFKYGDDINTDLIIPARYLSRSDPQYLARHCMEDLDPTFFEQVKPGDVIVAGANFGCGSSREHAPVAIKASGVCCVIAESFARIFYRNAINIGLPIIEAPRAVDEIRPGHSIRICISEGKIHNTSTGARHSAPPFPDFIREIISAGGLIAHARRRLAQ